MSKIINSGVTNSAIANFGTSTTAATSAVQSYTTTLSGIYTTTATVSGAWQYITECPWCSKTVDFDREEYIMVRRPYTAPMPEEMTLWHVPCYALSLVDLDEQMVKDFRELQADIDGRILLEPDQSFV